MNLKSKIGLIDVDGHNFPNLALMKISAYHKSIGDHVEWASIGNYDRIYKSKVFTFTQDRDPFLGNCGEIIKGGPGYDIKVRLPSFIDSLCPDYSIYPSFKEAYGYLTRGCINNCIWCIVPKMEGVISKYADIEEFLQGRKVTVLMDNNVLAHEHGLCQIEKIIRLGIKVDFNQGLDSRLIDDEKAKLLSNVKWYKPIRLACDTESQLPYIEKAVKLLRKHGAVPSRYFIYVLIKNIPEALKIIDTLRQWNLDPFAQPYRDRENNIVDHEANRIARYVNHKATFKSIPYTEYKY
jgi:hypothetical protein